MANDWVADRPERWPVASSTDLHRDDWVLALRKDLVRMPDDPGGEPFGRLVLEHPGAVVVLAVDERDRVLCLQQYRHALGLACVELPAGLLDVEGEEPQQVAVRELREEAAVAASDWVRLGSTYPSPGFSDEVQHLFLARGLTPVDRGDFVAEHEEAAMELFWVPYADLEDAVLEGRVGDGPVVQAVLLARARGLLPSAPGGQETAPGVAE